MANRPLLESYTWFPFRNDSGEKIPSYSIVEVSGVVDAASRATLVCDKTSSESTMFVSTGPFAVNDGNYGDCCVANHKLVKFTGNLSAGKRCKPKVNDWVLEEDTSGQFVCLGVVDTTRGIALVMQDQMAAGGAKLIKAPSGGIPGRVGTLLGSADCQVVTFDSAKQITVGSETIEVLNWAKFPACKNGDRYGVAAWVNTSWLIVAEDCSDTGSDVGPQSMSISGGSGSELISFTDITPSTVYIRNMLVGGTTPTGGTGGGFE